MAITASAGEVSADIKPRRPSWADMQQHYPAKTVDTDKLYNVKIRGGFTGLHAEAYMENTCAVRMSYALLRSGFHLARTTDRRASMLGADKRWYWLRVANLREELYCRFKGFDAELKLDLIEESLADDIEAMRPLYDARKTKAEAFLNSELAGKNGIIVFGVNGWSNATGHFTLWDGTEMAIAFGNGHDDPSKNTYYPWLTDVITHPKTKVKSLVQVEQIQFWELK